MASANREKYAQMSRVSFKRNINTVINFIKGKILAKHPIVNKYREGKLKRTLRRDLKDIEIARNEVMINVLCTLAFGKLILFSRYTRVLRK